MKLQAVLQALYDSEINASLSCFWDGGWTVKLGDDMNGFNDGAVFYDLDEAADWLRAQACLHWPRSEFAAKAKALCLEGLP